MQRVFSSPNLIEVTQLKGVLEEAGIACFVRNEASSGLIGGIPVSEGTPELWIEEDKDLEKALRLKAEWTSAPAGVGRAPWVCPTCGETLEGQFDTCWKCGGGKS